MLIPLTRETFQELIPPVATGAQYKHIWGKPPDFLRRILISAVAVVLLLVVYNFAGSDVGPLVLIVGLIAGLYWLWGPIFWASLRNAECRKYKYCGFWQGRILDVYITDEVTSQEETVNQKGQLVIVDNLEPRINLEVGDKTGFTTTLRAPLQKSHQGIVPGQAALMLIMSNQEDLGRIAKVSDIYIPSRDVWVSDYPYLRKDLFVEMSQQIKKGRQKKGRDTDDQGRKVKRRSSADY
ncbi:MAG: phosphate ABC transporter permease [Microcoleus sp. PH2017_39_LGB_O_B]|uniref:phosphate ABC transporter permease n=1 Tax=unclassified Microcoleus TaxID=2642155 RepID=UPI001D454D2B|nr:MULTISPECIES: phosphate ABC transporter permease [unclassified Microcoleus]MCC3447169.1 phosphate ABC transporter permease [Microcoleus sp. PH2017_09_SFU_O_A]MCC3628155.1 phosphate ABC transporter permease [Microcoleus sp. PH2017_39_LGB_O_B]MCC3642480.1 phosphate ABC transporter permease [Microcoleus sp. PH2017_33_LGB_O_A]